MLKESSRQILNGCFAGKHTANTSKKAVDALKVVEDMPSVYALDGKYDLYHSSSGASFEKLK